MFSTGRHSSVSSQTRDELTRARNGGRSTGVFGTPNSRGSVDPIQHMADSRYQDSSFTASMPDLMPFEMSSRATSGSPSTAGSSQHQQYPGQQQYNSHNPVHKVDNLMFPSEDPFAYPNQPMMELGFQPPVAMSNQAQSQFFMPGSMDGMDSQLLGQAPPYVIQHPEGQPGLEFSANMYNPNMFGVPMGQQSSAHSHQGMHPGQTFPPPRRPVQRRQERQIDQIFTEQGMQADWGSFFGSGRGVFQGM